MKNQEIIIALLVFIVILLIVLAAVLFTSKEATALAIDDNEIDEGSSLVVALTDSHGNPISDAEVNIKTIDGDGNEKSEDVTTDSNGKAQLNMDNEGGYAVECSFKGSSKYAGCDLSDTITVKKATTEEVSQETSTHTSKYAPNGGIYPEYGPEVDAQGITREYAIAHNMHYVEMTVDGDRPGEYVTVGGYTAIDPNTGYYHS